MKLANHIYKFIYLYIVVELDAVPTETESEVYEIVKGVLDESPRILEQLENYPGASSAIRQVG